MKRQPEDKIWLLLGLPIALWALGMVVAVGNV